MVSVQRWDQDLIKARLEMLQEILDAPDDKEAKKNIASKIGPVLDEQKEVDAESASAKPNHVDEDDKNTEENSTQKLLDETKRKQQIVEILDQLVSNDIATFVFLDISSRLQTQNGELPLHNNILSVQKRGNVFYLLIRVSFRNVEASVNGGPTVNYRTSQ